MTTLQQQTLESAIDILQHSHNASKMRIYKSLKILVKTLEQYVNNDEVLPNQTFIPCCLFIAPRKFRQILGMTDEGDILEDQPSKTSHNLCLQLYLKCLLKLLMQGSEQIKHIIISGMVNCIPLLIPYKILLKKYLKFLIHEWSLTNQNLTVTLKCYLFIQKACTCLAECQEPEKNSENIYMWVLRRIYVAYLDNCKQYTWRTYEHINFMINCICQLVRINSQRAYYVFFGYFRSIALQLDKLNKSKRKQKIQLTNKMFSNQILNSFRLFTSVVSRVDSEQFTALIYPLCQLIAAYQRISESPQFIPLKLHLLEYELNMSQCLNIYIPHTLQLLQKMIRLPIFSKKLKKNSQKIEANIELAYRLSKGELTQTLLINQLFQSLYTKIYHFIKIVCTMVSGPQILQKLTIMLKNNNFIFSEYKIKTSKLCHNLRQDIDELYELRLSQKMKVNAIKSIKNFEANLKKIAQKNTPKNDKNCLQCPKIYLTLKKQAQDLIKHKLAAENQSLDEENDANISGGDSQIIQDDDEVNSGWEEASEGASEFQENQLQQEIQEDNHEDVSYQGDPDDADEAVKQWSQQQWDSQDDI